MYEEISSLNQSIHYVVRIVVFIALLLLLLKGGDDGATDGRTFSYLLRSTWSEEIVIVCCHNKAPEEDYGIWPSP